MAQSDVLKPYVPSHFPQPSGFPDGNIGFPNASTSAQSQPAGNTIDPAALQRWLDDNHKNLAQSIKLLVQVVKQYETRLVTGGL